MNDSIPQELLTGLNEPQRGAVCHKDGPLLVLAGPGSGKTRVVTHRIAALLHQGVYPSQIVALTFTNKAADEMKKRVEGLIAGTVHGRVWMGTFHKFCAYLLRRYIDLIGLQDNFTIYDTDESLAVLKNITKGKGLPSGITPQKIQHAVSNAKNRLVLPDDYVPRSGNLLGSVVQEYYPLYQKELKRANAVDFDDLLLHIAVLLKENPEVRRTLDNRFRYVLVDEYQDTNMVQYVIAKALSLDHRNLAVTGDPDQSIYGWRGADIENILNFEKDYPDAKIIRLEQNYRSTPQILAVADSLIKNNTQRKHKDLHTDNPGGKPVRLVCCIDQHEEADSIAAEIAREVKAGKRKPSDYAVFYRMNALSRNLEHALRRELVPFQLIRGLEFYNRKEVKDVLAYLRLAYNPSDNVSLARIINEPARGIGATTLAKLSEGAAYHGVSTLEIARNIENFAGIAPRTKKAVVNFLKIIDKISEATAQDFSVESLISIVLTESGYRKQYESNEQESAVHASEEDQQRLANIDELLSVAKEFDTQPLEESLMAVGSRSALEVFLEQTALTADIDDLDSKNEKVSLMTLHAAKGLEFPVVYMIALEENILPHERCTWNDKDVEEERRLCFVGFTRAEEELRISRAERRMVCGSLNTTIYSRFLLEIPHDENVIQLDSPKELLDKNVIDYGDGVKLVIDNGGLKIENDANENDTLPRSKQKKDDSPFPEGVDPEYDDDGNLMVPKKKTKKRTISAAIVTGAELERKTKTAPI